MLQYSFSFGYPHVLNHLSDGKKISKKNWKIKKYFRNLKPITNITWKHNHHQEC